MRKISVVIMLTFTLLFSVNTSAYRLHWDSFGDTRHNHVPLFSATGDLVLNTSVDSLTINQNASMSFWMNIVNTSSNTAMAPYSGAGLSFQIIEKVDSDTNYSRTFLPKTEIVGDYWLITQDSFVSYKPMTGWLNVSVSFNSMTVHKAIPLTIVLSDTEIPVIKIYNLEQDGVYGKNYTVDFEVFEDVQLQFVQVLKDGQNYYKWDLLGVSEGNGSKVFHNSTYFHAHSLPLGYPEDKPRVNFTVRAMDYSFEWTSKSVIITIDSEGPNISLSNVDLVTSEYLSIPHIEIKKSDTLVLNWKATDTLSSIAYYKITVDGEFKYTIEENQIDLTEQLAPRSYAYTITIFAYDVWMNYGQLQVHVLVLSDSGEIYRDDLNGDQDAPDVLWRVVGLWSLAVIVVSVTILFKTERGRQFLDNSLLKRGTKKKDDK